MREEKEEGQREVDCSVSLAELIRRQRTEIGKAVKEENDRPRSAGFIINRYGL
jgi:hypothetical protein